MSRRFRLREIPSDQEGEADDAYKIDRRDFMRHSFNAAAVSYTHLTLPTIRSV